MNTSTDCKAWIGPLISITPEAEKQLEQLLEKRGAGVGIRITIESGGCAGWRYKLEFADELKEKEYSFPLSRGKGAILVSSALFPYIKGMELDYIRKGFQEKFSFKNRELAGGCRCGKSFRKD